MSGRKYAIAYDTVVKELQMSVSFGPVIEYDVVIKWEGVKLTRRSGRTPKS